MACLGSLPSEVLIGVVKNLAVSPNKAGDLCYACAVSSLSKCSHFYHDVCEPYLYKNINVKDEEDVLFLIRTLLQWPPIARLVRYLDVASGGRGQKTRLADKDILRSTRTVLKQLAVFPSVEERWRADLLAQSRQASVAVLIALLPDLVHLCISFGTSSEYFTGILQTAVREQELVSATASEENASYDPQEMRWPPLLGRLSTLSISESQHFDMELELILQLKILTILKINSSSVWNFDDIDTPQGSRIEHLDIMDCDMDEFEVSLMLQTCTTLRTFKYQWNDPLFDMNHEDGEWEYRSDCPDWFFMDLQGSQQTLESLELSGTPTAPVNATLCSSLANYGRLHRLQAPATMLLARNNAFPGRSILCLLPKSLTSLKIFIAGMPEEASLVPELVDFIQDVDRSPMITKLILVWQPMWCSSLRKDIGTCKELKEACAERAIVFSM